MSNNITTYQSVPSNEMQMSLTMSKMKDFPTLNNKKTKTTETATNDLAFHAIINTESLSYDDFTIQSSFNHEKFLIQIEEKQK